MTTRLYAAVASKLVAAGDREARMRSVVDALWESLHDTGVSWVGFYTAQPDADADRRLELGPCRDKPACTPIGVHGVCGQAYRFGQTRIVEDVSTLGEDYIACDPRDRSEIVVPLIDDAGVCWGVLDLDSFDVGAFDDGDASGLRQVLQAAGLMAPADP